MPGLELQVTLGQGTGDEPPLAVAVPAGATAAPAPAVAVESGVGEAGNAAAATQSEPGAVAVPGFEPTEEQMASFTQVTGAVRSVARGELLSFSAPHLACVAPRRYAQGLRHVPTLSKLVHVIFVADRVYAEFLIRFTGNVDAAATAFFS